MKPFAGLTPKDFRRHAVWEYCIDREEEAPNETQMKPVRLLPVDDLGNRIVGTEMRFANGDIVAGVLTNIDLNDWTKTEHFITLSLYRSDGSVFHLARYHDIDFVKRGPLECAKFFDLELADVFPISYDIRSVAIGVPTIVSGKIKAQQRNRLSDDELIRMAISS